MDKLNIFDGSPNNPPGQENRLTWAFLNLIRFSPIICSAFLDLVRKDQKQPIPAITTLREHECKIATQVGSLSAKEGRLIAIGITGEGRDVDAKIQSDERKAIYDGVVTFIAPEGRRHEQESLTFTIESKLGSLVEGWQLKPSKISLGEEQKIVVDPQSIILAWRDILSTLTDLELRGLVNPTEKILIRDFVDYVYFYHPKLNPFDNFSVCRDDIYLLGRRCEAILREIEPTEDYHGSSPIIKVENADAFKQVWLYVGENGHKGLWHITLELWPGDNMEQARKFWDKVDTDMLLALQEKGWQLEPNLHFSFAGTNIVSTTTQLSEKDYIKFWESHHNEKIVTFYPVEGSFSHNWEQLIENCLISPADVESLEKETTHTSRNRISMVPGLGVCYTWTAEQANQLDRKSCFVEEVKQRIAEATETWDEVPEFCHEGCPRADLSTQE